MYFFHIVEYLVKVQKYFGESTLKSIEKQQDFILTIVLKRRRFELSEVFGKNKNFAKSGNYRYT